MSLEERDLSYLIDMLKYSMEIMELVSNENRESFQKNRILRLAIERLFGIIGEAANHVSEEKQNEMDKIDWSKIIGMRNKLAHDYGEILADRVWIIASKSINELVTSLIEYGVKI